MIQQYNESNRVLYKMDTTPMDSENSKTSDLFRQIINFLNKIDW